MTFGEAIAALKAGQAVARTAWNAGAPKKWICLYQPNFISMLTENPQRLCRASVLPPFVDAVPVLPSIEARGTSHADVLAEDWFVVESRPAADPGAL